MNCQAYPAECVIAKRIPVDIKPSAGTDIQAGSPRTLKEEEMGIIWKI